MKTPNIIQVLSTPRCHRVMLDGEHVFTGPTEIDCVRHLQKTVSGWPDQYESTGPGIGQDFTSLCTFQRKAK